MKRWAWIAGALPALLPGCRSVESMRQRCVAGDTSSCESACDKGIAGEGGCFHAAEEHRRRAALDFGGSEFRRATDLYKKACDGRFADGCVFAAQALEAPYASPESTGPRSPPRMIPDSDVLSRERLLERACSLGAAAGCKRLGDVFIGKNEARARDAYAKACRAGAEADSCEKARAHEVELAEALRKRCTQRDADACTTLGDLLFAVDPPRAVRLFASECELRGVAEVAGGIGAFIAAREREATRGIPLEPEERPAPPPPGSPEVDARTASASGGVALVAADRVLSQHADALADCVAAHPPASAASATATLVVDRTGDVFRATVEGDLEAAQKACLGSALERAAFSPPREVATVVVTLSIRPKAPPAPAK